MKKFLLPLVLCLTINLCSVQDVVAYPSASSLKSELNRIEYTIKQNTRKISTIKSSKKLSVNEKKRQISKLESQNSSLKQKANKIRAEYKRAIS
jgi:biopolymer transport protein ExbD